jgi:hypothetical protein
MRSRTSAVARLPPRSSSIGTDWVQWRAIGYDGAAADEPPRLFNPPLTLIFDCEQYVDTVTNATAEVDPAS